MTQVATKPRVRVPARSAPIAPPAARQAPRVGSTYLRPTDTPFLFSWRPILREASQDVKAAWVDAVSRAIDVAQNSGWIAGAVDHALSSIVGTGLRLAAKPDIDALGWTTDAGQEWSQKVERRWEAFANRAIECDVEGKSTVGKLAAQAMRSFFCYGEVLAALPYVKRQFCQYGTKVQMLPPLRLVQYSRPPTTIPGMTQGVIHDRFGFPLAYRIRNPIELIPMLGEFRDVPARDMWGRTQAIHVFDGQPGQMRGIPPITPALKTLRQFDQLCDATLTTTLLQTIFAATIKSPGPTEDVLQAFSDLAEQATRQNAAAGSSEQVSPIESFLNQREGWYQGTQIDLGHHGKVAHLAPGDEFTLHATNHPSANYDTFAKFLLREVARCLGITFEDFTGDYSGATYSSVRMATSTMWMICLYRRINIIAPFYQAIYECWLEEDIENGWTPFPGGVDAFIAQRGAASRSHWRGPAKPQADEKKWSDAIQKLMGLGLVTAEWACAELGDDWEDNFEQIARENAKRKELGLAEPIFGNGGVGSSNTETEAAQAGA